MPDAQSRARLTVIELPLVITTAAFNVFSAAYKDTDTHRRFDIKPISHAIDNTIQFLFDNGFYDWVGRFNKRLIRLVNLFLYEIEIRREKE